MYFFKDQTRGGVRVEKYSIVFRTEYTSACSPSSGPVTFTATTQSTSAQSEY